jgi:hypothetical protein
MAAVPKKFSFYLDSQKAWEYIETGKNLDDLYPDSFNVEKREIKYNSAIQELLVEKEQYVLLDGDWEDYAITSLGRVINCKHKSIIQVYVAREEISVPVRGKKLHLSIEMNINGWKYNQKEVLQNYKKNNWPTRLK